MGVDPLVSMLATVSGCASDSSLPRLYRSQSSRDPHGSGFDPASLGLRSDFRLTDFSKVRDQKDDQSERRVLSSICSDPAAAHVFRRP